MAARNVQGIAPRKGPVEQFRAWILNPSVYWPLSVVTLAIFAGLDATLYDAFVMQAFLRWIAAQLYVALGIFAIPASMELETLIWFPIVWGGVLGMLLIVQVCVCPSFDKNSPASLDLPFHAEKSFRSAPECLPQSTPNCAFRSKAACPSLV
jgi:hypothetical protein